MTRSKSGLIAACSLGDQTRRRRRVTANSIKVRSFYSPTDRVFVLTGAGVRGESGSIPTLRGMVVCGGITESRRSPRPRLGAAIRSRSQRRQSGRPPLEILKSLQSVAPRPDTTTIAASLTRLWLASGWGFRSPRLPRARGSLGMRLSPWRCYRIGRGLVRVGDEVVHRWFVHNNAGVVNNLMELRDRFAAVMTSGGDRQERHSFIMARSRHARLLH